jgi:hypothetical protein
MALFGNNGFLQDKQDLQEKGNPRFKELLRTAYCRQVTAKGIIFCAI